MNREISQPEVSRDFNFAIGDYVLEQAGVKPENLPKNRIYGQYILAAQAAGLSEDEFKSRMAERKNQNWQNRN